MSSYQTLAYQFESAAPAGFGESIFLTGLSMVPFAIMMLIVAPLVGRWVGRFGTKPFYLIGSAIAIVGFVVAAFSKSALELSVAAMLIGAGLSALNIPNVNSLLLSVERQTAGLATSMNAVFRFLGSALGAPVAGVFIASFGTKAAFQYSFFFAIAMFAIVAILSLYSDEVLGPNTHAKYKQQIVIKEA